MENVLQAFSDTKNWAKVLGIVFIVGFALNLINLEPVSILSSIFTGAIPGILLFRYASRVKAAEDSGSFPFDELESACAQQGSYFKYVGIMAAIFLVVVVGGIAAAVLIPEFAQMVH